MPSIFDFRPHGQDPVTRIIFRIGFTAFCLTAMTTCASPAKAEATCACSFEMQRQREPRRHTPLSEVPKACAILTRQQTGVPRVITLR